jgi:5-formyltetrahydrofolate cyclo-ligase
MTVQTLREEIGKRRDALSAQERSTKSEQIWKRLVSLAEFQTASQALFYISFRSEVETSLMVSLSRELGMEVAAPRGLQPEKRMVFYHFANENELQSGPYGILQPANNPQNIVDLEIPSVILVPGLVFDLRCNRLGWGSGFYDRFLAAEGRGLPKLGLAFDCQVVDEVPVQSHDVPIDVVITETRVIRPRA